jgi:Zn-dependent M28 family amino/carboxypeptidase
MRFLSRRSRDDRPINSTVDRGRGRRRGDRHDAARRARRRGVHQGSELKNLLRHLEHLQRASDRNGGTRASGLPGYDASVDYVVEKLTEVGYTPVVQEFLFEYTEENSELERITPNPTTYINGVDFLLNQFDSGTSEGEATGSLFLADLRLDAPTLPPNTSTSGCEAADFTGMAPGSVALVQRGTCGFNLKVLNAQAAGASAVIVMNEGQPGRTGLLNMIGDATGLTIPAVFTTFDAGADLASTPGATVRVEVEFTAEIRPSYNVFAETASGDDSNVVMAGAHLDSVQDGAGINDNGSGSAAVLEVALKLAEENVTTANTVRFAWWAPRSPACWARSITSPTSRTDRGRVRGLLHKPRAAVPRHRVLGPLRLRAVHRGGCSCRWPVHRSRGREDRG